MKELDVLLVRYLDDRWPVASSDERLAFERFLELPDPELASYLVAGVDPPDPLWRDIAALLRAGPRR